MHGYTPAGEPEFLKDEKIHLAYDVEWTDRGDIDKFHFLINEPDSFEEVAGNGAQRDDYYLVCDDDLIYPPDYAQKMIDSIDSHDKKALITCHGTVVYQLPIANYYSDRYTYPCLGEVSKELQVHIGGTGVMGFHSDVDFNLDFSDKMPNMADIHVGIWAGESDIPIFVMPHKEDWIIHSPFVAQIDTISGKVITNQSFSEVADIINGRPDIFKMNIQTGEFPLVSIVVINTRMKSHPMWVKECYDSLRKQTYDKIEVIVIENYSRIMTIGKAFNDGVRKANGRYCLFVGDDDFISEDYVSSLINILSGIPEDDITVGITTFLTVFSDIKGKMTREARELIPTGMWERDYLLENPFKEYLTRYVDTELMDRAKAQGKELLTIRHHYGYYYRSHPHQSSGHKAMSGDHVSNMNPESPRIRQKIKELAENEGS